MRSLLKLRNRTDTLYKDIATVVKNESAIWHRMEGRSFPALTLNIKSSVIALEAHDMKLGRKDTENTFEKTWIEVLAVRFVDEPKSLKCKTQTGTAVVKITRWKTHIPFVKMQVLLEEGSSEQDAPGATSTAAEAVAFKII